MKSNLKLSGILICFFFNYMCCPTIGWSQETVNVDTLNRYPEEGIQPVPDESEIQAWKEIKNETRKKSRTKLLEKYLDGEPQFNIDLATMMLEDLLWLKNKYEKYLFRFPEGRYAEACRKKLENRNSFIGSVARRIPEVVNQKKEGNDQVSNNSANTQMATITKYSHIKNMGNSKYKSFSLRLTKDGNLIASKNPSYSGCRWEFEQLGAKQYAIKNMGKSAHKGAYLRFNNRGRITANKLAKNTKCIWQLESIGNNKYLLKNIGTGQYLRLRKDGKLISSIDSKFSGCHWSVML